MCACTTCGRAEQGSSAPSNLGTMTLPVEISWCSTDLPSRLMGFPYHGRQPSAVGGNFYLFRDRSTAMFCVALLRRLLEITQVRRRLVLPGRHQLAIGVPKIGLVADLDPNVVHRAILR